MPISRSDAEGLAEELAQLYRGLEQELAAGLARRLSTGFELNDWAARKLAAAGEVRSWATRLATRAADRAAPAGRAAVEEAFRRGSMQALRDLGRPERAGALPGQAALDRLALALRGRLDRTPLPIVRSVVDAYQRTAAAPVGLVLGGALTRRQAAERVWNGLLDQGFTAFTDIRGRRWTASGYAEMTTRTATAQAAVQGHLDRLESLGLDLVQVSDAPQECERCRPWEGKVLTREGPGGRRTIDAESELTGELVKIEVAGSVQQAIAEGLMHPSCRHNLGAYLPGLTKPIHDTEDPEGDRARQQLRYLERETRRWRLREAGALTDDARARAGAKVREWQGRTKAHLAEHGELTPRPDRARIDLSNVRREAQGTLRDPLREALDSGIEHERQLGGGMNGEVDLITTRDGMRLVRKRVAGWSGRDPIEEQDAEELGALVARAVGAKIPRVLRTGPKEVIMNEVSGTTLAEADDVAAAAARVVGTEEARSIALADILMGNTDRNPGNVIITKAGKSWGIDHGAAFQWHPEYNPADGVTQFNNQFADRFIDRLTRTYRRGALRPGEAQALRAELEALGPQFSRLKRMDWHRAMLRRLKALEDA